MKIIDLLNRIANKDYIPTKIQYRGELWWYDKEQQDYYRIGAASGMFAKLFKIEKTLEFINDEVQVNKLK